MRIMGTAKIRVIVKILFVDSFPLKIPADHQYDPNTLVKLQWLEKELNMRATYYY
jgi:hypothetical protein